MHLQTGAHAAAWLLLDYFSLLSAIRPLTADLDRNSRTFLHHEITASGPRTLHGCGQDQFRAPSHYQPIKRWRMPTFECEDGAGWNVCCPHLVTIFP